MANKFLSKKIIIPAIIFFGGLLIAFGVLILVNFTAVKLSIRPQSSQWTQEAGEGISVPACSSAINDSTCVSGAPSVTLSGNYGGVLDGEGVFKGYHGSCNYADISITDGPSWTSQPCNWSVTWSGATSGVAYDYYVKYWNNYRQVCDEFTCSIDTTPKLIDSTFASFTAPSCLTAICSVSTTTAKTGENVTWTAVPSGGGPTLRAGSGGPLHNAEWVSVYDSTLLARRFQATGSYQLQSAVFDLARMKMEGAGGVFSYTSGTLWVTLESDGGSNPSGTVLATSNTRDINALCVWGGCGTWLRFSFNNYPLTDGTSYWLVMHGVVSGNILTWENTGDNPAWDSRVHYSYTDPTWSTPSESIAFNVYGPSSSYTYNWTGTDELNGKIGNPVVVQYSSAVPSTKSGSVTVNDGTSGAGPFVCSNSVTINNPLPGDFSLSLGGSAACNSVPLSWTASSDTIGYRILRSSPRVDITPYNPYTALNFTDTSVSQNTDYKYQIEAYNDAGTNRSNSKNVTTPYCSPTLNFSGNPTSIFQGQSSTLMWDTTYTTSCTASSAPTQSDWSGSKALNGNQVVVPLPPPSVTYTMTCTGLGGSIGPQSVIINITPLGLPQWKEIIPR